jgi:sulfide:quinone oxidoreductase
LRLSSGAVADYDALVLATGARPVAAVPGAMTYRDHRDSAAIGQLIADLRAGAVRHLVLAVPAGVAWTLPLYELALLAAREIDDAGVLATVAVVTPERAPLEVFGAEVSAAIGDLLADSGITIECCARAGRVLREGLELAGGGIVRADRVLAVPRLAGRHISGVPANYSGFVTTDDRGEVESLSGVFAAGDMTSFPIKQGGIATQQADAIAAELARRAGADVEPASMTHVLRTRLFGPREPLFLQVELDAQGRFVRDSDLPALSQEAPWWPAAKLFGRHLSPWMARTRVAA